MGRARRRALTRPCGQRSPGGGLTCEREAHGDTGHVWVLYPKHVEPAQGDR